jgi:hypothetical protein
MDFFVPRVDGSGPVFAEDARRAWTACRRSAELDSDREASDRRIYSIFCRQDGGTFAATVGELDPYQRRERVMAIIDLGVVFKICCAVRGFKEVGRALTAPAGMVIAVEEFTESALPSLGARRSPSSLG